MEIILTDNAKRTLEQIHGFILARWNKRTADEFLFKVEKTIMPILKKPEMFKASTFNNVRKAFVTKQTSFFYEVGAASITILYFWNNRLDPMEIKNNSNCVGCGSLGIPRKL